MFAYGLFQFTVHINRDVEMRRFQLYQFPNHVFFISIASKWALWLSNGGRFEIETDFLIAHTEIWSIVSAVNLWMNV